MAQVNRRRFLQWFAGLLGGAWVLAVAYPVLKYLNSPKQKGAEQESVVAAEKDELAPGESKTFRMGDQPGLLVREKDGSYRAMNSTCTHLACIVQHRKEQGDIFCACHGGIYDMSGKNVSGPPPRPLDAFKTATNDQGQIVVTRA